MKARTVDPDGYLLIYHMSRSYSPEAFRSRLLKTKTIEKLNESRS